MKDTIIVDEAAEHTVQVEKLWEPDKVRQRRGLAAVVRLATLAGTGKYKLGAGGMSPNSNTPHSWVGGVYGSDCIGAVMWALRQYRKHKDFPEYRDNKGYGHINCDSAMMDAALIKGGKGLGKFFRALRPENVYPGCIVIYPSIRAEEVGLEKKYRKGYRVRIGHVGFVAGWEGLVDPQMAFVEAPEEGTKWDGDMKKLVTLECCSSTPAIRMRRNVNFLDGSKWKGHENEAWGVRFMEYAGP